MNNIKQRLIEWLSTPAATIAATPNDSGRATECLISPLLVAEALEEILRLEDEINEK